MNLSHLSPGSFRRGAGGYISLSQNAHVSISQHFVTLVLYIDNLLDRISALALGQLGRDRHVLSTV
jgi:hypothetical protein